MADPGTSDKTILVCDDDETMRDYVQQILESENFKIITAENGDEARRLAKAKTPDLLIIDAEMPVASGFEAIQTIRADPKTRLLPIILVTALKSSADKIKGIEAGCDDYISKPFDVPELLAKIRALLKISYYRQLLDEKEKFEYVLDHMNSGIVVLDPEIRLSQINKKARALLEINPAEGQLHFLDHLSAKFKIRYSGDLTADVRSKEVSFELVRPETEAFKPLILSVRSSSIKDVSGRLNSIVMLVFDVTLQKSLEMMKFTFLDFISHKLLTPLTSIDGSLSMIQEGNHSQKLIDICVEQSAELKSRITNILSFCEIMRGDFKSAGEEIFLCNYLPGLVETFVREKNGKKIKYEMGCCVGGSGGELSLLIEKKYFDAMIRNLVENAVEHNDSESVEIKIEAWRAGDNVEIAVTDNGRGIPPEEYDRIFDNFYQIEKWFTGNMKGVGLGLAMVKQIVTQRGGDIRVDSKLGKGTTFTLSFPFKPNPPA